MIIPTSQLLLPQQRDNSLEQQLLTDIQTCIFAMRQARVGDPTQVPRFNWEEVQRDRICRGDMNRCCPIFCLSCFGDRCRHCRNQYCSAHHDMLIAAGMFPSERFLPSHHRITQLRQMRTMLRGLRNCLERRERGRSRAPSRSPSRPRIREIRLRPAVAAAAAAVTTMPPSPRHLFYHLPEGVSWAPLIPDDLAEAEITVDEIQKIKDHVSGQSYSLRMVRIPIPQHQK